MSQRAKHFRHFMGSTVAATTQNILSNNSRAVKTIVEREQLVKTALGNDTWQLQPTFILSTAPMNPAKAQRIAASLHASRK